MSKLKEMNQNIETTVVDGYKKIEDSVVSGYKKMEDSVVSGYKKVEDKFIETFLAKDGETVQEARERITSAQEESK